jgi:DNA polymerase-3 subunit alpha
MLQGTDGEIAFERISKPILAERQAEAAGQFSLFGSSSDGVGEIDEAVLRGPELPKRLLLAKEKEVLGQYVTDHPLLGIEGALKAQTTTEIPTLDDLDDGDLVTVGGVIGSFARKYTKKGEPYAQFRLEGLAGGVEVVAFPSVYDSVPELMGPDEIVLVTGRIDRRGRELQIRANGVKAPQLGEDAPVARPESLVLDLPATACTPAVLERLKGVLAGHPGPAPVKLRYLSSNGVTPLSLGSMTVTPDGALLGEVRGLLGPGAARLVDGDDD